MSTPGVESLLLLSCCVRFVSFKRTRNSPPAVRNELGVSAEVGGQLEEALLNFLHTREHPHHHIFVPHSRMHAQTHAHALARMHAQTPFILLLYARCAAVALHELAGGDTEFSASMRMPLHAYAQAHTRARTGKTGRRNIDSLRFGA